MALALPGLDKYLESGGASLRVSDEADRFWLAAYTTLFHEAPPPEEPLAPNEWDPLLAFWMRLHHRVLLHIHRSGEGILHPGAMLTANYKRNSIGVLFVRDKAEIRLLWMHAAHWTTHPRITILVRSQGPVDHSRTYEALFAAAEEEDGSTLRAVPAVTDAPLGDNLITVDLINNTADVFFGGEGSGDDISLTLFYRPQYASELNVQRKEFVCIRQPDAYPRYWIARSPLARPSIWRPSELPTVPVVIESNGFMRIHDLEGVLRNTGLVAIAFVGSGLTAATPRMEIDVTARRVRLFVREQPNTAVVGYVRLSIYRSGYTTVPVRVIGNDDAYGPQLEGGRYVRAYTNDYVLASSLAPMVCVGAPLDRGAGELLTVFASQEEPPAAAAATATADAPSRERIQAQSDWYVHLNNNMKRPLPALSKSRTAAATAALQFFGTGTQPIAVDQSIARLQRNVLLDCITVPLLIVYGRTAVSLLAEACKNVIDTEVRDSVTQPYRQRVINSSGDTFTATRADTEGARNTAALFSFFENALVKSGLVVATVRDQQEKAMFAATRYIAPLERALARNTFSYAILAMLFDRMEFLSRRFSPVPGEANHHQHFVRERDTDPDDATSPYRYVPRELLEGLVEALEVLTLVVFPETRTYMSNRKATEASARPVFFRKRLDSSQQLAKNLMDVAARLRIQMAFPFALYCELIHPYQNARNYERDRMENLRELGNISADKMLKWRQDLIGVTRQNAFELASYWICAVAIEMQRNYLNSPISNVFPELRFRKSARYGLVAAAIRVRRLLAERIGNYGGVFLSAERDQLYDYLISNFRLVEDVWEMRSPGGGVPFLELLLPSVRRKHDSSKANEPTVCDTKLFTFSFSALQEDLDAQRSLQARLKSLNRGASTARDDWIREATSLLLDDGGRLLTHDIEFYEAKGYLKALRVHRSSKKEEFSLLISTACPWISTRAFRPDSPKQSELLDQELFKWLWQLSRGSPMTDEEFNTIAVQRRDRVKQHKSRKKRAPPPIGREMMNTYVDTDELSGQRSERIAALLDSLGKCDQTGPPLIRETTEGLVFY